MDAPLRIETEGELTTLVLQRPDKRNALSAELVDRLQDAVHQAHQRRARVLVLRGEGRNFSAGFDFADIAEQSEGDLLLRFVRIEQLLQALASSPCLTVGLAQGRNFGAGVDLLAACRLRVAAADATFRMPGLQFGLLLGTRRFGDIVGRDTAARVLQGALTFDAGQALAMGFVHQCAEPAQWPAVVADARSQVAALDDDSREALYRTLSPTDAHAHAHADSDLAALVRSAARPGLKERVARYLAAGRLPDTRPAAPPEAP